MLDALDMVYRRVLRRLLFRLDAESSQKLVIAALSFSTHLLPRSRLTPKEDPKELRISVFGQRFSNPVGLGAGVDKNARAALAWQALGFGFAELGTITPAAQVGNPRPRIRRLPGQRALINSLGFPSMGSEWALRQVTYSRKKGIRIPLGLNFGPNKTTPREKIAEDYEVLMTRLGRVADFVVINVSSPNTPRLRELQAPERIAEIVETVRSTKVNGFKTPPLLIKVSPDLPPEGLREFCSAAMDLKVDGIVATNTTVAREEIGVTSSISGGVSGEPLKERARDTIRRVYSSVGGRIPIIGVGGIATALDAYEHICAGASLVEFCTGFIYEGPGLPRLIKDGLVEFLRRDGFSSVGEAVGSSVNEQRRRVAYGG